MADKDPKKEDPKTEDPKTEDPKDDDDDDDGLEEKIKLIVRQLISTRGTPRKTSTGSDPDAVAEEVRRELANVRKSESAEAERRGLLDRLTNLEKAESEKPPVLRRRIEKIMGWVHDDE